MRFECAFKVHSVPGGCKMLLRHVYIIIVLELHVYNYS